MIDEGAVSNSPGRGVRLKITAGSAKDSCGRAIEQQDIERNQDAHMISAVAISAVAWQISCIAGLLGLGSSRDSTEPHEERHGHNLRRNIGDLRDCIVRVASLAGQ